MKNYLYLFLSFSLSLFTFDTFANDEIKQLPFNLKTLPSSMTFKGNFIKGLRWIDKNGENYVIFSNNKKKPGRWFFWVNYYRLYNQNVKRVRLLRDKKICQDKYNSSELITESISLTDLDNDSEGEVSFVYKMGCHDGKDSAKLMLLENKRKYAVRGSMFGLNNSKKASKNINTIDKHLFHFIERKWTKYTKVIKTLSHWKEVELIQPEYTTYIKKILNLSVDMDGDYKPDNIQLGESFIKINNTSLKPLYVDEQGSHQFLDAYTFVDLTPEKPGKELILEYVEGEDYSKYIIISYFNNKLKISGFAGDRFMIKNNYILLEGGACGQSYYDYYMFKNGELEHVNEGKIGKKLSEFCMACPFVYTMSENNEWLQSGEILRYLNSKPKESLQSLKLKLKDKKSLMNENTLTVKILEAKKETTYLDLVYIESNGRKIFPQDCSNTICKKDNKYLVLQQGESIILRFNFVPDNNDIKLWASGYYEPL